MDIGDVWHWPLPLTLRAMYANLNHVTVACFRTYRSHCLLL